MERPVKQWIAIERDETTSDLGIGLQVDSVVGAKGRREVVIFGGVRFYRYPDSKHWAHRAYFKPHVHAVKKGVEALHIEIWKWNHGSVPEGHTIHHRDHNPLNNRIENLQCLTHSEHSTLHGNSPSPQYLEWKRANIVIAQDAAKAWHGSPEGREWHREHAKKMGLHTLPKVDLVCAYDQCSKQFIGRSFWDKFCSDSCKQKFYYHRDKREKRGRFASLQPSS